MQYVTSVLLYLVFLYYVTILFFKKKEVIIP